MTAEAAERKIEELEAQLADSREEARRITSQHYELKVRYRELHAATCRLPEASHAMRLAEHLISGPGVMLEEPKRAAWLRDHPLLESVEEKTTA